MQIGIGVFQFGFVDVVKEVVGCGIGDVYVVIVFEGIVQCYIVIGILLVIDWCFDYNGGYDRFDYWGSIVIGIGGGGVDGQRGGCEGNFFYYYKFFKVKWVNCQ